jgi:opacity protein-like surface antigen
MKMRMLLLLAALTFPTLASAQSLELFALTGVVQLWDDEGNLGSGVPFGGGVGFRSAHGWGIEALIEGQKAARHFESDVRFDSSVTAGRARILKYFGEGTAQVYAGAGVGATRITSTYDYPAGCGLGPTNQFQCTSRDVHERTSTSGTLSGVFGVRVAATPHLFVRPEFEVSRAGEHMRIGGTVAVGGSW